jgi:hypothetical protein
MSIALRWRAALLAVGIALVLSCVTADENRGPGQLEPPEYLRDDQFIYAEGYASGGTTPDEVRIMAERNAREQAATSLRAVIRAEIQIYNDELTRRYEQEVVTQIEELEFVAESRGTYTDEIGRTFHESYVVLRMPPPEERWQRMLVSLFEAEGRTRSSSIGQRMTFIRQAFTELQTFYSFVSVPGVGDSGQLETTLQEELDGYATALVPSVRTEVSYGGQALPQGMVISWTDHTPAPRNEAVELEIRDAAGNAIAEFQANVPAELELAVPLSRIPPIPTLHWTMRLPRHPEISSVRWVQEVPPPRVSYSSGNAETETAPILRHLRDLSTSHGLAVVEGGDVGRIGSDIRVDIQVSALEYQESGALVVGVATADARIDDGVSTTRVSAPVRIAGVSREGVLLAFAEAAGQVLFDLTLEVLYGDLEP